MGKEQTDAICSAVAPHKNLCAIVERKVKRHAGSGQFVVHGGNCRLQNCQYTACDPKCCLPNVRFRGAGSTGHCNTACSLSAGVSNPKVLGTPATHPLTGRALRALRRLQREQKSKSPFVCVSERSAPFSTRGFQAMVERAAKAAGFDMKIHPHMLRHSCGYKLANDGVDTRTIQSYLGHKSIQHTVGYTELAPTRFRSLFRD